MFNRQQNGFTTVELMVVTAIAGILVTVAIPHLARWRALLRVNAAARTIASDLQLSRMNAISQNARFRVNFNTTDETYQLQKWQAGTWQTVKDGAKSLPKEVDLVSVSTDPVFQTLGNTLGSATIVVQNTLGRTRTVNVSSTGRVKVQ